VGALPAADGYVITTPTSTHAAVIEALLPTGGQSSAKSP